MNADAAGDPAGERRLVVVEWTVACLLTALAVALHGLFLTHAGALWRDEASTVWLATRPSLSDVWRWLPYDHCTPMVHLAIRAWWSLGLAYSDLHLRVLGLLIGLLQLAALWVATGAMRRRPPVLLLALVGINATIITVGDSFRGYGLGATSAILVVAAMWRLVERPTRASAVVAAAVAVLSVQCLYQNAIFVLAACCGAASVFLLRRRWAQTLWPLGVGALAAASLLPYLDIVRRAQEWYALEKAGFQWAGGWLNLSSATGYPVPAFNWVWVALSAAAVGVATVSLYRRAFGYAEKESSDLSVFAGVAMVVAVGMFAGFLKTADLPTQAWYYTTLMAFMAVCLDAVLSTTHRWARVALTALAAWAGIAALVWGLPALETRQTNVDMIAARLNGEVSLGDYVIVHPWYCGATFARYYTGAAPWTTLPPLEDHFLHRYDLLKVEIQKERPIDVVLQRIATTLQRGNRVWLVGGIPLDGTPPPEIRPAPDNPWGWFDEPYSIVWGMRAGHFITSHATGGGVVMKPSPSGVNPFENLPVVVVTGWR
ncbi:MAG: hypothetical protein NTV05_17470 [Acidobacteria bacterium]|nr:hypothetical protein [Acidobacteriota bacterium]